MAEPFSIAASVVGVAGVAQQLATSVWQIKTFCRDVKDAPQELSDLLDQLMYMIRALARISNEDFVATNGDVLQEALKLCHKAAERVSTLANRLQSEMERRRRYTALKVAFKKKDIASMLAKLDRTKTDLHLACSLYSDARTSFKLDILRRYMEEACRDRLRTPEYGEIGRGPRPQVQHTNDAEKGNAQCSSLDLARRSKPHRRSETWSTDIHIRLPPWLCQYACDISFVSASGKWTTSLKTFKIVPTFAIAHLCCVKGRAQAIKGLLEERELSVHDRFEENPYDTGGHSLIEVSVTHEFIAAF